MTKHEKHEKSPVEHGTPVEPEAKTEMRKEIKKEINEAKKDIKKTKTKKEGVNTRHAGGNKHG